MARIFDYDKYDAKSPFSFKEPLKVGEATEKLRSNVPPISKFLQSIDEETAKYVEQLMKEADTIPFPFTTKGTGQRVEQFLKENGYNWMAIEEFTPEIKIKRNLNDGKGDVFKSVGYDKLWIKRRMNHFHKDMVVQGLRTYTATSLSSAFSGYAPPKNVLSPYKNLPFTLLKYDVAGSEEINQDKFKIHNNRSTMHISYGVQRGNSKSFLTAIESPMFFILGPSNIFKKDENGHMVKKYDEKGIHIGWEEREVADKEWLLLVFPYTKDKPFVINQQMVSSSGGYKEYESYFAISLKDDFNNGGRGRTAYNPNPNLSYQKYVVNNLIGGYPISSDAEYKDAVQNHITYRGDIRNKSLSRNFNYNFLQDMSALGRNYPNANTKKEQFNLATKRGKLYKTETITDLKAFDSYNSGLTIYGVLMKTDESEERDYRLRQLGYGIINQTGI